MIRVSHTCAPSRWPVAAFVLGLACALFASATQAADQGGNDSEESKGNVVLQWHFDGAKEPGEWQGKTKPSTKPIPGPRAPRYPGFDGKNQAAYFSNGGNYLVLKDREKGGDTDIRFGLGDSLTIETWLNVKNISNGDQAYLVGKGRHGDKGQKLGEMNQNYAVRLKGAADGAQLGFLFTSEDPTSKKREWHRWWSTAKVPTAGWHHIAVVYTFGQADSLRAYIDGKPTKGTWDMGGATSLPPVNDADDLVIGTGYRRTSGESFDGWMDNLIIRRDAVSDKALKARYAYTPPPPPVTRDMVPSGKVLMQISEKGVPEANEWPTDPEVTETYQEDVFGFFDWPQKYISTGVRADRSNPSLVRAAALVTLPKGKHRLLLRSRGASKLYINGTKILENPFPSPDTGGHGLLAVQDKYLDLGPDFRFAPPGNRENWCEFESNGKEALVVLETMIGGMAGKAKRRPEFGETVVAVSLQGGESWSLLSPGKRQVAYTDEGWSAYEAERRAWLDEVNAKARAVKRTEHNEYWSKRREAAKAWLATAEAVPVPSSPKGYPANNEIDNFINTRIAEVAAETQLTKGGGIDYFKQVKPILEAHCYDCHTGGKAKGGLHIDQHASMLKGGKGDGPAIVAGDASKSSLIARIVPEAGDDIMPPKGEPLSVKEIGILKQWVAEGAHWPQFEVASFKLAPLTEDLTFLRRLSLDTIGVPPSEAEIQTFLKDDAKTRRSKAIDRLLSDRRWADNWMGYWQDVLAENPNIINPTLNNTGPFRWWLYESLQDNKPVDLFVTELLRMEGSERFGGPAGFATASQNDVPMAAKGIIVSGAFLGVEMKCARCHDAPSNISKQEDLFQLAAMLQKETIKLPVTSTVPLDRLHQTGRKPLIEITLKPGAEVKPAWPFNRYCEESIADKLAEDPDNSRDRLATLITAPQNERFAQVMVNRMWRRFMGRGIVDNLADWEKAEASHPELLRWLGRQLVASGYDFKAVARLIFNSQTYQRAVDPKMSAPSPLFLAHAPRRLMAEQIVDSLFSATGKPFRVEEVSLDIDSVRAFNSSITLGQPYRAWMLASTSNERDRPSLSLPRIQAVASVMETFGWRGARQDPVNVRDTDSNVLQPAILANGTMGLWLTRLSDDNGMTKLAMENQPLEQLIDRLFMRLLTRHPSAAEKARFVQALQPGYEKRVVPLTERFQENKTMDRRPEKYVSWSNHLDGPANTLAQEKEAAARRGDAPTKALNNDWRLRMEDVLWAMLNAPEWIYEP